MEGLLIGVYVVQLAVLAVPSPILYRNLRRLGGRHANTLILFLVSLVGLGIIVVARMWLGYLRYRAIAIPATSGWGLSMFAMLSIADYAMLRVIFD